MSKRQSQVRVLEAPVSTEKESVSSLVRLSLGCQPHRTSNDEDGARLDVCAQGFWGNRQSAFFYVRVFNPLAPSNCRSSLTATYRQHEATKRRAYEQRVREIEHGSFTPLVFSATGGMAPAATTAYKRLASLLADKRKQGYSKTICWLRCAISFSLVRSAVMCLRGARSSLHRPSKTVDCEVPLDMAICEGRIPVLEITSGHLTISG